LQARLRKVTKDLALAWLLAGTCLAGHLLHCWPGIYTAPAALQWLATTELHAFLSVATLLGPGAASCAALSSMRTAHCFQAASVVSSW
jgi:hypothetical protein